MPSLRLNVISQGRMGRVFCISVRGVFEYSQDRMQKNRAPLRVFALAISLGWVDERRMVL